MTTQRHKTPVFYNRYPVIDSDFDNLGGELTWAQIRDPVPSSFDEEPGTYIPRQRRRKRQEIYYKREWLQELSDRLHHTQYLQLSRGRKRLQRAIKPLTAYQPEYYPKERFIAAKKRLRAITWHRLYNTKDRLQGLAQRLRHVKQRDVGFQLRSYPLFWFPDNLICNNCVPYNGRHTINYWATGQADCW